jgi:uncharacterized protein YggU (UPF0235/DUF167 family)
MGRRILIRVKPNSRRVHVGGSWGSDRALMVAVTAPPTEGRSNKAVIRAVSDALDVPRGIDPFRGESADNEAVTRGRR